MSNLITVFKLLIVSTRNKNTNEFTIVNKRIIVKTGIVRRKTLDINLGNIESVNIEQSIWGRILGSCTITITGAKKSTPSSEN
ncbi:MAG: PH domain-containing protein [Prevotellaceae bacterium]|jgi:uncharacterized membrane protein YdbT with pleckstrin-like domain|nr:PH domain-containing protein [Prevotellaceae bacterium]